MRRLKCWGVLGNVPLRRLRGGKIHGDTPRGRRRCKDVLEGKILRHWMCGGVFGDTPLRRIRCEMGGWGGWGVESELMEHPG